MKNLIYQVWAGEMRPGCEYSSRLMKEYAKKVGAEYRLDISPNIASKLVKSDGMYWEWLNPIIDDSFLEYDKVLVVDLDIYPRVNLSENIFDVEIDCFGLCTEPFQGKYRASTNINGINAEKDLRWSKRCFDLWKVSMPRDKDNFLKVYNAGMVMFSKEGIQYARKNFMPFASYTKATQDIGRFYSVDQNYFHMEAVRSGRMTEMHNGWNSYIHYVTGPLVFTTPINDSRDKDTKFVHIQMRGADFWDEEKLFKITNRPVSEWNI